MELENEEMEIIRGLSINDLAEFSEQLLKEKNKLFEQYEFVSHILIQKMEEDEAKKVVTPDSTISITYTKSYDHEKLLELFNANELLKHRLLDNGGYIPEKTVTVPAKFNMTKINPLIKEGKTFSEIITDAEIVYERRARLKITTNK
tara:strand:- start:1055 stop:1495 length:441 start_codon:yes stop_codon:yes gene_type:complete